MPGPHGLVVLQDLVQNPDIDVVIVTGYGSIATAVEAMRLGARDYLTKPVHADRILAGVRAEPSHRRATSSSRSRRLPKLEREHIERVLRECNGNVSKAARVLGMHRRTLQYKLAKFPVNR